LNSRSELKKALSSVALHVFSGNLSHIVQYKYRHSLLSVRGARLSPGRYHKKGGAPALYFADTPLTALYEVDRAIDLGGIEIAGLAAPGIIVSVQFELSDVLDVTDPAVVQLLGTSRQELTGSWMYQDPAPTQMLGEAAHDSTRIVAIRAPSAARGGEDANNLVVFHDRVDPHRHRMVIHDPHRWLSQGRESRKK
jgi:RES domain-containing protein